MCEDVMVTETLTKRKWGAGRVAFLARRDRFLVDLEAGWSAAAIYARHGMAEFLSEWQFRRYLRRYLGSAAPQPQASRPAAPVLAPVQIAPSALRRSPAPVVPGPAALVAQTAGFVDVDAFASRPVDLDQLARIHKQQQRR